MFTKNPQHRPYNSQRQDYPKPVYNNPPPIQTFPDVADPQRTEFKRFKCPLHPLEYIKSLCLNPRCLQPSLFCEQCIDEKKKSCLLQHHDQIINLDDYFDCIMNYFEAHRKELNDRKVIPQDIADFLESEPLNTKRYTEHNKNQKRVIDDCFGGLIKAFISLIQVKSTEIKTTLDLQNKLYQQNYNFLIEKIMDFYEYTGIRAFSPPFCGDRSYLSNYLRRLRETTDLNNLILEIKHNVVQIEEFSLNTEKSKMPRKHEDEILSEIRRCIAKLDVQGNNPITLKNFSAEDEALKGFNTNINFYAAYQALMKDIERVVDRFEGNLKAIHKNEDMTIYGNEIFRQTNDVPDKKNNFGNFRSQLNQFRLDPTAFETSKKFYIPNVTLDNYFYLDTKRKVLPFFDSSIDTIHILDVQNLQPQTSAEEENGPNIQSYRLETQQKMPYNYCSIVTPCGRVYMCGGVEQGIVLNTHFEVDFRVLQQQIGETTSPKLIKKESMRISRCSHGICMLDSETIFVAGGYTKEKTITASCEVYNIVEDRWIEACPMFAPYENICLCNFGNEYIYRFGAKNDRAIDKYIIQKNKWERIEIKLPEDLGIDIEASQITEHDILIFGGNSPDCLIINVNEGEMGIQESIVSNCGLRLPEKTSFHCPKLCVVYNKQLYAVDYGRQKILVYKDHTWSYLN